MKKNPASIKLEIPSNFLLSFNKSIPAKLLTIPIIENITGNILFELHLLESRFIVIIGVKNVKINIILFNI